MFAQAIASMSDGDSDDSDGFLTQMSQNSQCITKGKTKGKVRASKAAEKQAAKLQKALQAEERGKSKEKEIAIVVYEECQYLHAIHKKFGEKLENKVKMQIFTDTCNTVKGLFRWTHRKISLGGACSIGSNGSEVFPYVVIDIAPADVVNFLDQSADGMDFTAFNSALKEYVGVLHEEESCPMDSRIVILVIGMEQYLSKLRCRPGSVPYSRMFDNASAVAYFILLLSCPYHLYRHYYLTSHTKLILRFLTLVK